MWYNIVRVREQDKVPGQRTRKRKEPEQRITGQNLGGGLQGNLKEEARVA
jgi:hypothetical protein